MIKERKLLKVIRDKVTFIFVVILCGCIFHDETKIESYYRIDGCV